jgi:serine phosphatase RsbU (regulator of sigma subunit)
MIKCRPFLPLLLLGLLAGGLVQGASAQDLYWESPEPFSQGVGTFPVSASNGERSVVAWQETSITSSSGDNARGTIKVMLAVKDPGGDWIQRSSPASYDFSGAEPAILSAAVDKSGRILIAVGVSTNEADVLISSDSGINFVKNTLQSGSENTVAPRIFARSDGGYLLFVTRGRDQNLSLYYSRSDNGRSWSSFVPFVSESGFQFTFLPSVASLGGADYLVFQSQVGSTFQLFFRSSTDGGASWSAPRRITTFQDPVNTQANVETIDNERPHLSVQQGQLFIVWERRIGSQSPQIYSANLNTDGSIQGRALRVNTDNAYCNNPIAVETGSDVNNTAVIWFDNSRGGERVFMARRIPGGWERGRDWSGGGGGEVSFARPRAVGDGICVWWQARRQNADRIYALFPDRTVAAPVLVAGNFTEGRRARGDLVQVTWAMPQDSSGIAGYSWAWSRRSDTVPPPQFMLSAVQTNLEQQASEDGTWYLAVRAQDFAGNWSKPAVIAYVRDTTPPPAAAIIPPEVDDNGYLISNTFDMRWNTPPASDIAGYTWNLEYLGPASVIAGTGDELEAAATERYPEAAVPPRAVLGPGNSASYDNQDNGLWCFAVSAVDEVGNIGGASRIYFKTNKYVPHTFITLVDAHQDEQGYLTMNIIGRGFAEGGQVTRVILDKDGEPPYDKEFVNSQGGFTVLSDREIGGIRIQDLEEGEYRVILLHPLRGTYITPPLVTVDKTGTVKFGDYGQGWKPSWSLRGERRFVFDTPLAILLAVLVFCAVGILVSARGIGSVVSESAAIRLETIALLTGDIMPSERKKRMTRIKKKGAGLRLKLASFTIGLVLLVVLMISAPLYYMMTRTQQETLLQGLWDRSSVLLEGLASSAKAYMPTNSLLELGYLPAQSAAVPEARYVTITGYGSANDIYNDHVLATNDGQIGGKIDSAELQAGVSRVTDALTPRLDGINRELNEKAKASVGGLSASLSELLREGQEILASGARDAASQERLTSISGSTAALQNRINTSLTDIAREIGSEPQFSTTSLKENKNETYIFFKPVLYRQGAEENYVRGMVRLEVGIESIRRELADGQVAILRIIAIVAFAALVIGTIGALALATLIIGPITRLVSHVERIRDTEDKTKLEGVDINIKTHDELAVLGNTINEMTHGLVKAAAAASDLSIGKEIQKKFIPLDVNREGNKLSSGLKDTRNVRFFGYYEGAKGVSGDYFDYQDLDGRYYAIIKCDVAGKGIPAALIMIQVATMFLNYFKQWKPTEKGMHIEEVVYQINDFIETLAFKGRFAAFTLCLFDSHTGIARFCNAGDNIIHWYDASEGRMKTLTLKETPATGVLPNFLVETKGGYTVQTLTMEHGDILFLYTDGIEEAKRKFRDADFKEIICEEGEKDTPHETHTVGQGDEEMGPDRVFAIINAVMNKQTYILHKWHNPEGENNELKFDFSTCEGRVDEAIMAMVSVEKMFRLYKNPKMTEENRVLVDRKIDEFLKKHFLQYRAYCLDTKEIPGNDAYMYYTHVGEDDQYDDLTILGINRK